MPNYNNSVWAAAVLLAETTGQEALHDIVRTFLRAWQGGKAPQVAARQEALQSLVQEQRIAMAKVGACPAERPLSARRRRCTLHSSAPTCWPCCLQAVMQAQDRVVALGGERYRVVEPACVPERNASASPSAAGASQVLDPTAKQWEDTCDDGVDNDCDGLIDDDDPDCPFTPVKATRKGLSWTEGEPAPNAAAAAFIAMAYSSVAGDKLTQVQRTDLRCWALGQAYYLLGRGGRSYVVGFGPKAPQRVQHMESSCASGEGGCDWASGFYAGLPNPRMQLVEGALVAGPDLRDAFPDSRASPSARVGVHYNAPFSGLLAALLQEGMQSKACGQLRGIYQDLFERQGV